MAFPVVAGVGLMEYALDLFRVGADGRVVYRRRLWFVVRPQIRVLRAELLDFERCPVKEEVCERALLKVWSAELREYLFRKRVVPTLQEHVCWDIAPELLEEDRLALKRLYVLEEL